MSDSQTRPASSDSVHDFIVERIASGAFRPGEKLPAERALAERFGAPRNIVRKALARLDFEGRITRGVGRGTFVSGEAGSASEDLAPDTSPADLMEARLALEPQLASLVVANATATDFQLIEDCLKRAHQARSADEFEHWDRTLHQAIALAAHNGLLIRAYAMITRARNNAGWGELKRHSANSAQRTIYHAQHRAIVKALRQRDGEAARARIVGHLLHVRRNMLGY